MATVKHSYIKGAKLSAKARAHLNYIQHRPGEDKAREGRGDDKEREGGVKRNSGQDRKGEEGDSGQPGKEHKEVKQKREPGRPLRVPGEESQPPGKAALDFRKAMLDPVQRGKVVHRLILSPPSDRGDVDMNKYTQETMTFISQQKGQELRYAWVVHDNTDNRHAHVIVLGKDTEGHNVRLEKFDHSLMRAYGDEYMRREHSVEHEYHRNPRAFAAKLEHERPRARTELIFDKEIEFQARIHAHNLYTSTPEQNLYWMSHPHKRSTWEKDEDFKHLLSLNKNWGESLEGPAREGGMMLGETWQHDKGRLSEIHDLYSNTRDRDHWQDIQNNTEDQGLREYAAKQIADLEDQREGTIEELQKITGLDPDKFDQFIAGIQAQFAMENLEIDMALFPEKYEPLESHDRLEGNDFRPVEGPYEHQDIDIDKVKNFDKVELYNGEWISKYDSKDHLEHTLKHLGGRSESDWIERSEYAKVCEWIDTKQEHGEDCYGQPPLKEKERELSQETDPDKIKEIDKIQLYNGNWVTKYDSRESLDAVKEDLWKQPDDDRLEKDEYAKLCEWIETKQERGDDCYGQSPLKEREQDLNKEIDLDKIKDVDKMQLYNGNWITKYDSREHLDTVKENLWKRPYDDRLEGNDYAKLCEWIETKEARGDGCYGEPPVMETPQREKEFDQTRPENIDVRSMDFDKLSTNVSREERDLQDLVAPRQAENPELTQIDYISEESPGFSIDETLENETPSWDIFDNDNSLLSIEETQILEESMGYEIERPDSEPLESLCRLDLDFDSGYDIREIDQVQDHDLYEIEPICDIEQNGGEEYDLPDDDRERIEEERTDTDRGNEEKEVAHKHRDDDSGR